MSLVVRLLSLLLLTLLSSLRAMLESIFMTTETTLTRRPPLTTGPQSVAAPSTHHVTVAECAPNTCAARGYFWPPKRRLNHESATLPFSISTSIISPVLFTVALVNLKPSTHYASSSKLAFRFFSSVIYLLGFDISKRRTQ